MKTKTILSMFLVIFFGWPMSMLCEEREASDTPTLLQLIRTHTPSAEAIARIQTLIEQLGSRIFQRREKATQALIQIGTPARAALLKATKDTDSERAKRAQRCLEIIDKGRQLAQLEKAVQLLGQRKSKEAVDVLLNFAPFVDDDSLTLTLTTALTTLAKDQKELSRFRIALKSAKPEERAIAAVALTRTLPLKQLDDVQTLLKDDNPEVRMQVGIALAKRGERKAVSVLITLIDQLPQSELWQIEELLYALSTKDTPPYLKEDTAKARKEYREAWEQWWQQHGEKIDLAQLEKQKALLGYTMIIYMDKGIIRETDRNNKVRWEVTGLKSPLDAQVLPGQRVLIAEYSTKTVSERTWAGKIIWQKVFPEAPIRVERVPTGQTLVTTHKRLILMNRDGTERNLYIAKGYLQTARRFANGNIACIVSGTLHVLSAEGKEKSTFAAKRGTITSCLDTLTNGHILLAEYGHRRVVEMDTQGKVLWQVPAEKAISTVRLPNGNTLVSQQDGAILEYGKNKQLIKKFKIDGHPTQVRRR